MRTYGSIPGTLATALLALAAAHATARQEATTQIPGTAEAVTRDTPAPSDAPPVSADRKLRIELSLWAWLVGLEGDVGVAGRSASVSEGFIDVLDTSDSIFAFSGRLEIGYERLGFFLDGFYADLGVEDQTGPAGAANVDVSFRQGILDFGAMYRVGDWDTDGFAPENRRNLSLDLYAGGRYSGVELNLRPANVEPRTEDDDWVDPIVGARVIVPLGRSWHVAVNGDIGGFGVASDLTWSATAVIGYNFQVFHTPAALLFGYRAIGWDYENEDLAGFTWDVIDHGPLLGFQIAF